MKMPTLIKLGVYALAVILSLGALWLAFNAPPEFLDVHAVYNRF